MFSTKKNNRFNAKLLTLIVACNTLATPFSSEAGSATMMKQSLAYGSKLAITAAAGVAGGLAALAGYQWYNKRQTVQNVQEGTLSAEQYRQVQYQQQRQPQQLQQEAFEVNSDQNEQPPMYSREDERHRGQFLQRTPVSPIRRESPIGANDSSKPNGGPGLGEVIKPLAASAGALLTYWTLLSDDKDSTKEGAENNGGAQQGVDSTLAHPTQGQTNASTDGAQVPNLHLAPRDTAIITADNKVRSQRLEENNINEQDTYPTIAQGDNNVSSSNSNTRKVNEETQEIEIASADPIIEKQGAELSTPDILASAAKRELLTIVDEEASIISQELPKSIDEAKDLFSGNKEADFTELAADMANIPPANAKLALKEMQGMQRYTTYLANESLNNRLNVHAIAAGEETKVQTGMWVRGIIGEASEKQSSSSAGYNSFYSGVTIGVDAEFNSDLLIGAAFSTIDSSLKFKNEYSGDKISGDTRVGSIYGMKNLTNKVYVSATTSFILSDIKTRYLTKDSQGNQFYAYSKQDNVQGGFVDTRLHYSTVFR